jgi:hypothetical protein
VCALCCSIHFLRRGQQQQSKGKKRENVAPELVLFAVHFLLDMEHGLITPSTCDKGKDYKHYYQSTYQLFLSHLPCQFDPRLFTIPPSFLISYSLNP